MNGQPILVVLGMHKSGTTLVARMLHESGISMGEFDASQGYDQGNFYERLEVQHINTAVLQDTELQSFQHCEEKTPENAGTQVMDAIQTLVSETQKKHEVWGFKDPRTCLTYSIWAQALPTHGILFVYRHPAEVCRHYIRRIAFWRVFRRMRRAYEALKVWHKYNELCCRYITEGCADTLVMSYRELMTVPESLEELERFVGQPLKDCRDPQMYRAHQQTGWYYRLADRWLRLAHGDNVEALYARMERLHRCHGELGQESAATDHNLSAAN